MSEGHALTFLFSELCFSIQSLVCPGILCERDECQAWALRDLRIADVSQAFIFARPDENIFCFLGLGSS